MKKYTSGFTLIELLVVIAIIGILSSVVLASLSSARKSANRAADVSEMANMRAQAEIWYNSGGEGSYTNLFNSVNGDQQIVQLKKSSGATAEYAPEFWFAFKKFDNGDIHCVDSAGFSGLIDNLNGTNVKSCNDLEL